MRINGKGEDYFHLTVAQGSGKKAEKKTFKGQLMVVTADPYDPDSEADRQKCRNLGKAGDGEMLKDRPFWHLLGCNLFAVHPDALKGLIEAAAAAEKESKTNDD